MHAARLPWPDQRAKRKFWVKPGELRYGDDRVVDLSVETDDSSGRPVFADLFERAISVAVRPDDLGRPAFFQ